MRMKVVLHYRHTDGRKIEISGNSTKAEVWLIYPARELLSKVGSVDEGKEKLPEGFALEETTFMPPCPKCSEPSPMALDSGMYVCRECSAEF